MQVSVEATKGLERKISIVLPADQIESAVSEKLKDTARRVRIDGFRPGKVPVHVVKQRFGAGIRQEVLEDKMRHSYVDAITKEEMKVAGYPRFEAGSVEEGKDFDFNAFVEVYPEVKLNDFSSYELTRIDSEINDADVEEMLKTLQQQKAEYSAVKRASKDGDQVNINYLGKVDGEAFEGGKAEKQDLVLGSNSMIPGFEAGIVGMKAGDEKTIDVTFPADYQNKDLASKAAQFDIVVNEVKKGKLPELDKAFFESFDSKAEDIESFTKEITKNMEREASQAVRTKNKEAVIEALVKDLEFDIPAAILDEEIARLQQETAQQFGGGQGFDPSQLPKELFTEQAERRVRVGLIFSEITSAHSIVADEASVKEFIEELASVYEEPQTVIDYYTNNEQQSQQIASAVLEEKVVKAVYAAAKVEDKKVEYKEAIRR